MTYVDPMTPYFMQCHAGSLLVDRCTVYIMLSCVVFLFRRVVLCLTLMALVLNRRVVIAMHPELLHCQPSFTVYGVWLDMTYLSIRYSVHFVTAGELYSNKFYYDHPTLKYGCDLCL